MAKFIVCPRCRGEGNVVNPEVDGNGITAEEFDEDPDFRENYFSGVYDVLCPMCRGKRVTTRAEYNQYLKKEHEDWAERRVMLMESGIYPGHRDYF